MISINFKVKKTEKHCQPSTHPNFYKTEKKKAGLYPLERKPVVNGGFAL